MIEYGTRIQYLKGVGEARAKSFAKLGIFSVGSLLRFYPRGYEDWSTVTDIAAAPVGESVCLKATLCERITEVRVSGGRTIAKSVISDDSGILPLLYFNNKYIRDTLTAGETYLFFGKISLDKTGSRVLIAPRHEKAPEKQRIRPVYKASASLNSKNIERVVETALREIKGNIPEILPEYLIERYRLMPLEEALFNIHFPGDEKKLALAKRRLIFEELLVLQLGLNGKRISGSESVSSAFEKDYSGEFFARLPFEPTNAQKRATAEAMADMMKQKPMNRLLQGDVGSGKTAVAAALMYSAVKNGFQSALMAPTEVLASQHYKTLCSLFGEDIRVELLTGSTPAKKKREILAGLVSGEINIITGTHAVIQSNVEFSKLGLVITDEQHRFGVAQRTALTKKGDSPHTLVMSATPIPRTLAMMIYGDLDISVIDELPKGRQPIKTYSVDFSYRDRLYKFLRKTVDAGHQAYIVCPLIEESDSDLVPATEYYELLKNTQFKEYTLGLLHGAMKPKQKEEVMARFYSGEIQILISTVVIEVGVDVPNATVMLIENAERFGLSQLHQLRGRIGRGGGESTCVLISQAQNEEALERFRILCETTDGFVIAKRDLELRGPGDFFGSRQHGLPDMHIANLMTDTRILYEAQKVAKEITDLDPYLEKEENKALKQEITRLFEQAGT